MAGEEAGEEVGGPPVSPHLLPIPVPGIPAEQPSAQKQEGEAGSGPLPCSDLPASSPEAAGPRGPFCMDSELRGHRWAWVPLSLADEHSGTGYFPATWKWAVSERQSRKGLRWGM